MADWSQRREAELEGLARLAANEKIGVPARAAAVLVAHARLDAAGCLCGWGELGRSHARHVADALAEAGLLASGSPPDPRSLDS